MSWFNVNENNQKITFIHRRKIEGRLTIIVQMLITTRLV